MQTEIEIRTGHKRWDELYPRIKSFLTQDTLDMNIDGALIRGYRSPDARSVWIRDYSDMLRGVRYFEKDLTSTVTHFAETQARNGRIFDYFTTFPEKPPCEKENWTKYVRVPVEADVEYRFVKAAFLAWQACGDDSWIQSLIPSLKAALEYSLTHPWRWDPSEGLLKRPYTIDTWDFAYTGRRHDWLQFQIDKHTVWGIMHGDNSGLYEAMVLLAGVLSRFHRTKESRYWLSRAMDIKDRMNRLCWNGRFYTHFVPLIPVDVPEVETARQLSLSNPMAVNRGAADHRMAVSILNEYRSRRRENLFAEWFSIDPPFPPAFFGDDKLTPGAYVNGGIMPLVGGEMARAALEHGMEIYGVDILNRYARMIESTGKSFLWYFPDGTPSTPDTSTSPEATSTDGWGSSAMLWAFVEGLAGIQDCGRCFDRLRFCPRWSAAGVEQARVRVGYPSGQAETSYSYECRGNMRLEIRSPAKKIEYHILLPPGTVADRIQAEGRTISFQQNRIENSLYADWTGHRGKETVEIRLRKE
ncbi:MAG TPA: hypothetical protein ENN03_09380 [bacterium]|nr:hypothetical protein [bacterium]